MNLYMSSLKLVQKSSQFTITTDDEAVHFFFCESKSTPLTVADELFFKGAEISEPYRDYCRAL